MWTAIVEVLRLLREVIARPEPAREAPYVDEAKMRQDVSAGEAYRRASKGPFR